MTGYVLLHVLARDAVAHDPSFVSTSQPSIVASASRRRSGIPHSGHGATARPVPLTTVIPTSAVAAIVAAVLLETGSCVRGELLFLIGLPLTLIAFAFAARGSWMLDGRTTDRWRSPICACLSVMAAAGLGTGSLHGPIWYELSRRLFYVTGIITVGIVASGDRKWSARTVGLLTIAAAALHLMTPVVLPDPNIDVWTWTQACVRGFLHGVHPYRVQAPDELRGAFDYGYTLTVYPYMPATILAYAPVVALAGDFRFLLALSLPATILLVRATGRHLHSDETLIDIVSLAILLHPRSLPLTALGWTEPLLVVVAAAFAYFVVRAPEGSGQATAFFLLPALKQYVVAPIVLYLVMRPRRASLRSVLVGVGIAGLTIAPFLAWDWRPTLAGIVFQMIHLQSPRLDSDSLVALSEVATGRYPDRWWSVMVQFLVAGVSYWRLRHAGAAGLLLASATTLFATFLFGWQAFFNYYYLVAVLLLLGALLLAAPERELARGRGPTLARSAL